MSEQERVVATSTDASGVEWETGYWTDADGTRRGTFTRAVCKPDGYCADGHRCGKLDVGIVRGE